MHMHDYWCKSHRTVFMIGNKEFFFNCESIRLNLNSMKWSLIVIFRDSSQQSDLLVKLALQMKRKTLDRTVDNLYKEYDFSSIVKVSNLLQGAMAIRRSKFVGNHNGGNVYE